MIFMQIGELDILDIEPILDLHLNGLQSEIDLLNQILPGKKIDHSGRSQLKDVLLQMVRTLEGKIFAARDGQKYVGYSLVTKKVYPVESPRLCGSVNGIYILDDYRRQGIGRKLFDVSMKWLKSEGVEYIELYHMINDEGAAAFWQSVGFVPTQINCARFLL